MILKYGERDRFMQRLSLGTLTYLHFYVDFACAFWMNYMIICCYEEDESSINVYIFWLVLLYNFCAFVLQLPLGMLADRLHQKKHWWMAAFACVMIGIAGVVFFRVYQFRRAVYGIMPEMIVMPFFLGLGNALFHVGAGVRVLQMGERMTSVGIFVSSGAFGIFLGGLFWHYLTRSYSFHYYVIDSYMTIIVWLFAVIAVLSFVAAVILLLNSEIDRGKINVPKNGQKNSRSAWIMFLLFMVVTLRSFQGSFLQFSWDGFFPITMIFTLSLMYKHLPKLPGTAFGLLSFALFVGHLPRFLFDYYKITALWYRNSFWKWSVADISTRVGSWWMQYHGTYVYSIVTGISLVLLVFLLCLCHRKERWVK